MEFEEHWKHKWIELDFPENGDQLRSIYLEGYRAGLLHAAKQDREMAMGMDVTKYAAAYAYSAAMHEETAIKDLK
jgi:hypothetical protein